MIKKYYHCSPVRGITALKPTTPVYFDKPVRVFLTDNLVMSLFYGIRHFEYTYGYNSKGQIYFMEHFPNALAKLYEGKKASLYVCEGNDNLEKTEIPGEYLSPIPVKVVEEIKINDLYEELLKQEKEKRLIIVRYEELNIANREWIVSAEKEVILEKGLLDQDTPFAEYMRTTYPESWSQAKKNKK